MKRILMLLAPLLLLPACTTPYHQADPNSTFGRMAPRGVYVKDLGNDTYNIYAMVHSEWDMWGGRELALKYFDMKKEEIVKEKKYSRCETLYVVGLVNYTPHGGQADGRIRCLRN